MPNNIEHIFHKLRSEVSLSQNEKARMEGVLREYMGWKPLRVSRPVHRYFMREVTVAAFTLRKRLAPTLLIVALFAGGGVSYAAEGSLPGDLLYPVKVSVNEEVRGALAVTPEAKATWDTRRVERRLEEAVTLAVSGQMTPQKSEELAKNLDVHGTEAAYALEELEQKEPDEAVAARSDFDATLAAHGDLLDGLGDAVGSVKGEVRALAQIARGKSRIALFSEREGGQPSRAKTSGTAQDGSEAPRAATFALPSPAVAPAPASTSSLALLRDLPVSAEALNRLAQSLKRSIDTATKLLADAKRIPAGSRGSLDATTTAGFEANLAAISAEYESGVRFIGTGDLDGAYVALGKGVDEIHRLILAIKTSTRFRVDISTRAPIRAQHGTSEEKGREGDVEADIKHDVDPAGQAQALPIPPAEAERGEDRGGAKAEAQGGSESRGEASISGSGSGSSGLGDGSSTIRVNFRIRDDD